MSRPQTIRSLRSISFVLLTTVGLGIAEMSAVAASPEEEIARLNRVRANLFEELVKTRAEAATAASERDAALKARDAAEAELARLKQEAASAKPTSPVPSTETKAQPQQRATTVAAPAARRQSVRLAAPAATGSVLKTATAGAQRRIVRTSLARRAVARKPDQAPRPLSAPVARAQELPSVLRLQDSQ